MSGHDFRGACPECGWEVLGAEDRRTLSAHCTACPWRREDWTEYCPECGDFELVLSQSGVGDRAEAGQCRSCGFTPLPSLEPCRFDDRAFPSDERESEVGWGLHDVATMRAPGGPARARHLLALGVRADDLDERGDSPLDIVLFERTHSRSGARVAEANELATILIQAGARCSLDTLAYCVGARHWLKNQDAALDRLGGELRPRRSGNPQAGTDALLIGAVHHDLPEWVALALRERGDPNLRCAEDGFGGIRPCATGGRPLLHCARSEEVAAHLLKAGAAPDARDERGRAALHLAEVLRHAWFVRLLLQGGADQAARDSQGRTPGDVATYLGVPWPP